MHDTHLVDGHLSLARFDLVVGLDLISFRQRLLAVIGVWLWLLSFRQRLLAVIGVWLGLLSFRRRLLAVIGGYRRLAWVAFVSATVIGDGLEVKQRIK